MLDSSTTSGLLTDLFTSSTILIGQFWQHIEMVPRLLKLLLFGTLSYDAVAATTQCSQQTADQIDLGWHAPNATQINNLTSVINGTGIYGFVFNTSTTPATSAYGTYNWCNMPHVRPQEYVTPPKEYKLEYVEVVCFLCYSSSS
jgi:hypothetical protein